MLAVLLAAASLTASCRNEGSGASVSSMTNQSQKSGEVYTLTFFTNNSNRTVGQGKMEQDLIDLYMREHPYVRIEVETLSPDPQYQDKIKVYTASNKLPDIISTWGNSNFLKPLVESGAIAEIDRQSLRDLGFVESAMDGYSFNGKLYGFPRNSDFWVLYYNKKIFADNGLKIPKKEADLMDAIAKLKGKGIVPIAIDGREAWTSGIWFDTMLQRVSGTWDISKKAMDGSGSFRDPSTVKAAEAIQRWVKAGAFGSEFLNQDYGAARNLFSQGQAAMFMMGEWEMGMASDLSLPEDVRENIGAFAIPAVAGGEGESSDLTAWFGGGYSVSETSAHKEKAIAFLKWMFRPDNWAKGVWQSSITFPAQKYYQFITGTETELQKELSDIYTMASSYSGTVAQDKFTTENQKIYYDSLQLLENGSLTPEQFTETIANAAKRSQEDAS